MEQQFSIEDDQKILEYLRNNCTRLYSPQNHFSIWRDIVYHLKNDRLEEWNVSAVEVRTRFLKHILNRMFIVQFTDTQTEQILYPFLKEKYNIKIRYIDRATQAPNRLSVRSINYHRIIIKYDLKRNCFDSNIYKLMRSVNMPYLKHGNATTINIADMAYELSAVQRNQLRSLVRVPKAIPTVVPSASQWISCKQPPPALSQQEVSDSSLSSDEELVAEETPTNNTLPVCSSEGVASMVCNSENTGVLHNPGSIDDSNVATLDPNESDVPMPIEVNVVVAAVSNEPIQSDTDTDITTCDINLASVQEISVSERTPIEPQQEQPSDQIRIVRAEADSTTSPCSFSNDNVVDETLVQNRRQWAMNLINKVWSQTPSGRALLDPNLKLSDYWNEKTGKYDLNLHE